MQALLWLTCVSCVLVGIIMDNIFYYISNPMVGQEGPPNHPCLPILSDRRQKQVTKRVLFDVQLVCFLNDKIRGKLYKYQSDFYFLVPQVDEQTRSLLGNDF